MLPRTWREAWSRSRRPLLVAILSFFVLALLTQGARQLDELLLRKEVERAAENAAGEIDAALQLHALAVASVAELRLSSATIPAKEFSDFARRLSQRALGIEALGWSDAQGTFLEYESDTIKPLPETQIREALSRLPHTKVAFITEPFFDAQGEPILLLFVPAWRDEQEVGTAIGAVRMEALLQNAARVAPSNEFQGELRTAETRIPFAGRRLFLLNGQERLPTGLLSKDALPPLPPSIWREERTVEIGETSWSVRVEPTARKLNAFNQRAIAIPLSAVDLLLISLLIYVRLKNQRERLRETLKREEEFVSLVSHQLRNPMTQTVWTVETVIDHIGPKLSKNERESLDDLREISRNAARLVENLLNVSRLERGVLHADLSEVTLPELLHATLTPLQALAAQRHTIIHTEKLPPHISVWIDLGKAAEALRNVIDNAVKYSPPKSRVLIEADISSQPGSVVVRVKDAGPGIPPEFQSHIFEKSSALIHKGADSSSTGLGLYLTKKFMQLMDGSVRFETSSKGTTFFLTFKRATDSTPIPAKRGASSKK